MAILPLRTASASALQRKRNPAEWRLRQDPARERVGPMNLLAMAWKDGTPALPAMMVCLLEHPAIGGESPETKKARTVVA